MSLVIPWFGQGRSPNHPRSSLSAVVRAYITDELEQQIKGRSTGQSTLSKAMRRTNKNAEAFHRSVHMEAKFGEMKHQHQTWTSDLVLRKEEIENEKPPTSSSQINHFIHDDCPWQFLHPFSELEGMAQCQCSQHSCRILMGDDMPWSWLQSQPLSVCLLRAFPLCFFKTTLEPSSWVSL